LRLFFALSPPPAVRRRIAALQAELKLEGRPEAADRVHLTLAFLGEVPEGALDAVTEAAARCSLPACRLRLDRLGWFSRARVAWLGCTATPPALGRFQAELTAALEDVGLRPDRRRWHPHVTLYRKLRSPFAKISFEAIDWPLQGFDLVHSRLEPAGPKYRSLRHWPAVGLGD